MKPHGKPAPETSATALPPERVGGLFLLKCPTCGAALPALAWSQDVTCGYCRTDIRAVVPSPPPLAAAVPSPVQPRKSTRPRTPRPAQPAPGTVPVSRTSPSARPPRICAYDGLGVLFVADIPVAVFTGFSSISVGIAEFSINVGSRHLGRPAQVSEAYVLTGLTLLANVSPAGWMHERFALHTERDGKTSRYVCGMRLTKAPLLVVSAGGPPTIDRLELTRDGS